MPSERHLRLFREWKASLPGGFSISHEGESRAFSLEDVKRAASLARLEISDAESQRILDQLSGVFELIAKLESVDTEGVEPMAHAQDIVARLRADVVTESDKHELFQSIAPAVDADLYLVPKVIE